MAILSTVYDVESNIKSTPYTSVSPTQTVGIVVNRVLTITRGVLSFETNGTIEYISFGAAVVAAGRTTLVDVVRNLTTTLNDFSQISATGLQHVAGITVVKLVNYHALYNLKAGTAQANTFSYDQTISGTRKWFFNDTDSWIYDDGTDLKFKSSAQAEVSLAAIANGAGINDKAKVSAADTTEGYLDPKITAGAGLSKSITNPGANEVLDIAVDLTDTNVFSSTPVAGKAAIYNPEGNLDTASLATSGTAKEAITDKDVLVTDPSGRLARADADAIATTFPLAGIATGAAAAENDPVNYVPMGSIVEIPSISLAEHANGNLAALTPTNTTENTATDVQNAATQHRAQTFTASSNAWENNLSAITLKLTKTGAPTGDATLKITSVSGGVPVAVADITQAVGGSSTGTGLGNTTTRYAQTFVATSSSISAVSLRLQKSGSPTGDFTVEIRELVAGDPTGAVVGTASLAYSAISTANDYMFTFAAPVAVTCGTSYAIVAVPGSGVTGSALVLWYFNASSVYAGGHYWFSNNSGTTYTATTAYDFRFAVFATNLGTATLAHSSIATGLNTFNFSTPIALALGAEYAIVLDPGTGVSGGANIAWNYQTTDVYAGGNSATSADSGATWTAEATFDRYFSMQYRSINGIPAYVSPTTGAISLAPGTYAKQIGKVVDRTHIAIQPNRSVVFATYTFATAIAGETVDTELTTGFSAGVVLMSIAVGSGNAGSVGHWVHGGGNGTSFATFSGSAPYAILRATLGHIHIVYASALNMSFVPVTGSNNSFTIRRSAAAHTSATSITVYLTIIEL